MKKLIFIAVMSLLLMNCGRVALFSPYSGQHSGRITIHTTTGQELIELKQALDTGAITQEEYDDLRKKIIERLDAPVDSTDTN